MPSDEQLRELELETSADQPSKLESNSEPAVAQNMEQQRKTEPAESSRAAAFFASASPAPDLVESPEYKVDNRFPRFGSNYSVVSVVGQGGMGTVYQVADSNLCKPLAIKVLRPELATDQAALKRFEQESRALSDLNHPNIVAVFASGKTESGAPYLVMDYIAGQNLAAAIRNLGGMDVSRSISIFIEIGDALHYAHDRGIIHRDLKPSNIILGQSENGSESARVVDFGIAKVIGKASGETVTGLTQMGDLFGTPSYMSPEQCQGEKLDARSDIYSFGCVMFETLSGAPPFNEANPFKLMTKHVSEKAPSLTGKGISQGLSDIVAKCLEKKPERRYQNIDELLSDLVAVRQGKNPKNASRKRLALPDRPLSVTAKAVRIAGAFAAMLIVGTAVIQIIRSPITDSLSAVTGSVKGPVEAIAVFPKPNATKPLVQRPPKQPAPKLLPPKEEPLSEVERGNLRNLLYDVAPTSARASTIEPVLQMGKRAIPTLLEFSTSVDTEIAKRSSIVLGGFGTPALPGMIQVFKADTGRYIDEAIRQMGSRGAVALQPLLSDPDPQVRARAANTISQISRTATLPTQLSRELLWLALEEEDAQIREAATKSLGRSTAENTRGALSYLALNDPSALVRTAACDALVEFANREADHSSQTIETIGWIIQQDDSDLVKIAAFRGNYMRNNSPVLAPYLRVAFRNGSKEVRKSILSLCHHEKTAEALLPELVEAAKDKDTRYSALFMLGKLGGKARAALPALNGILAATPSHNFVGRTGRPYENYEHKHLKETIDQISKSPM